MQEEEADDAALSVSYVCEALLFQVDLLSRRCAARAAKDYRTADALRDMLVARFGVDLNDRDNTWRGGGRVGTQDGPDFFEDRPARLHRERMQRKRVKQEKKAALKASQEAANAFTHGVGDKQEDASASRDPKAFVDWLREGNGPLKQTKSYAMNPELAERCIDVVEGWRERFPKHLWLRLLGGGSRAQRLVKELLEALPVIARVLDHIQDNRLEQPITLLDLCSGFGYLSMFLAELLPPERFDKIVLLDKAWPMHSQEASPTATQINPEHILRDDWPIRLTTSKTDLKSPSARRSLDKHIISRAPGPLILLGIHLCGQLSVRAIELFNSSPNVTMLALKPCCLPQIWAGQPSIVWQFSNGASVSVADVGIKGRFVKNVWRGPPRSVVARKFARWSEDLYEGIDAHAASEDSDASRASCLSAGTLKQLETIHLGLHTEAGGGDTRRRGEAPVFSESDDQVGTTNHYQNRWLWAYRAAQ